MNLEKQNVIRFQPKAPYNFDANFHKPSHFPSSDTTWEPGRCWITMLWQGQCIGLKFKNEGTVDEPAFRATVYSGSKLSSDFITSLKPEIAWRFNFAQDISNFCDACQSDTILGPLVKKWLGMKPIAANSLYETLVIYIVLQNATVRRTVQMLENLFNKFGKKLSFDGKTLSAFWDPKEIAEVTEEDLRELKLGYRAKYLKRISEQFVNGEINELILRKLPKDKVKIKMLKLYGVGPASVEYLLFEDFYFLDGLETIPPWEHKIMSRLVFGRHNVASDQILEFFQSRYPKWSKLAFHYVWEDVFWRRKNEHIEWLEKEIRL